MNSDEKKVPPEIKVTVELLLDTEKKVEKLQDQLDKLNKSNGPSFNPTPPKINSSSTLKNAGSDLKRAELQKQIADLKNQTIQITDTIEQAAVGETRERVSQLKSEWIKDMEPLKSDEHYELNKSQKRLNRTLNKDWEAPQQGEEESSAFKINKEDIDGRKESYLEKASSLKEKYDYLNYDDNKQNDGLNLPGENTPDIEEPAIDLDK